MGRNFDLVPIGAGICRMEVWTVERRKRGPDVWCFGWREAGPDGRRIHRRMVLRTADELRSIAATRKRPWSRCCSLKKHRKRGQVLFSVPILCPRENGALPVSSLKRMAGTTGLEPSPSAVTDTRIISDLHSRGGCQVAERDCKNLFLWVNLWVRVFRSECVWGLEMDMTRNSREVELLLARARDYVFQHGTATI